MKLTLKMDMVGIITSNFAEMRAFYHNVIGLEVIFEMEGDYVEFKMPGTRFGISTNKVMAEFTRHPSYNEPKKGQTFELAFILDTPAQVDETFKEIIAKGAKEVASPADMPWGHRTAFFADPDGNIHELFASLPEEKK